MKRTIKSVSCTYSSTSKGNFIVRKFRLNEPIKADEQELIWATGLPSSIPSIVPAMGTIDDMSLQLMGIALSKALTGSTVEVEVREEQLMDGQTVHKLVITDIEY